MIKLLIKVKPNSHKDEICLDTETSSAQVTENSFIVKIRAKPIDGEANDYLIKYLAKEFGISRSLISIDKGATSRLKRITLNIENRQLEQIKRKYKG